MYRIWLRRSRQKAKDDVVRAEQRRSMKRSKYIPIGIIVALIGGSILYFAKVEEKQGFGAGVCEAGDCVNGRGTQVFPDGRRYIGDFVDGVYSGQGTLTMLDGRTYEGQWKESRPEGWGIQTNPDNTRYEGEWMAGKYQGQGTLHFPDGRIYTGGWIEDVPHGEGTLTHTDGRKYVGQFRNGKINGKGILVHPDGREEAMDFGQ